jgi:uncharacterized UBP type Zn finger protein
MSKECNHFTQEKDGISPNTKSCEVCEKEHLPVVAIRMCLTCGHVGCCDSSIGKHATKHFQETGHFIYRKTCNKTLSRNWTCNNEGNSRRYLEVVLYS